MSEEFNFNVEERTNGDSSEIKQEEETESPRCLFFFFLNQSVQEKRKISTDLNRHHVKTSPSHTETGNQSFFGIH